MIALCAIAATFRFGTLALGEWFTCGAVAHSNACMLYALVVVVAACAIVLVVCGAIALLADNDSKS